MGSRIDRSRRVLVAVGAAVLGLLGVASSAKAELVLSAVGPTGSTYDLYVSEDKGWSGANAVAQSVDGHLVTITSPAEQAFVEQLLVDGNAPTGQYWMGFTRSNATTFGWITGEPLGYQHWEAGEPNNLRGEETAGGVLWSQPGASTFARRGFWNDLPDRFTQDDATYPDLNTGGYIVERGDSIGGVSSGGGNPSPVPVPPALFIAPIGMLMAWRAKRWVGR
jgi:hypothetical protein